MGSMLRGEWIVVQSCGDIFCRAIMVAFEVGEGWNRDIYPWCWVQLTNERVVLWVEAGGHKSWIWGDKQRGNSKGVLSTEQSSIVLFLGGQAIAERTPGEFYPGKHRRITHQQNNR